MKINRQRLKEIIRSVIAEEKSYEEFFRAELEKAGFSSPAEMSDAEKREFFNRIDSEWKAKNEELVGNQHKLDIDGDGEIEASDLAALRAGEKKEESVNEDVNWGAVQNAIINFLKMNTKILEKRVQAKDTEGVKGGLNSIISGLTNAQRSLKLESVNEEKYPIAVEKFNKELIKHPMVKEAELPNAQIPSSIKAKLDHAIDKIQNSKLTYNQKLQVVGKVVDSLGIDKAELSKMSSKLKTTLESVKEQKSKYYVEIDSPREVDSNRVKGEIKSLMKRGARSADIGLRMNFLTTDPKDMMNKFQKVKNHVYFANDPMRFESLVKEKWEGDVTVKKTGEHAGKTIEQLQSELSALKTKSKTYQDKGEKVPQSIIDQEREIVFAIRAKKGWPKGKGSMGESTNESIEYSKDGYVKKMTNAAGKFVKDITLNGVQYRYNPVYKTYNSVKGNDLLHKKDILGESVDEGVMKPGKKIKLISGWAGQNQPTTNDKYVVYQLVNNRHFSMRGLRGGMTYLWKAIESTDPHIKVGSTEEIHPKALKQGIKHGFYVMESVVKEGRHDKDLDKVEAAVKNASSFMEVGAELKKAGIKYDFSTSMMPMYRIKVAGNTIAIVNKRYASGAEREVGDIAIGLLEGKIGRSLKVENLSPDVAKHMVGIHKGFQKVEGDGTMIYDTPANAKKAADFLNKKKVAASSDGKYLYIESKTRR